MQSSDIEEIAENLQSDEGKDEVSVDKPKFSMPSLFDRKKAVHDILEYNFEEHGPLVAGVVPEGYREIEEYWVDKGRTLVIIALNLRTNQNEYLLFEPALSEFEYELLERIHEDMRSALILTEEELVKNKKRLLIEKKQELLAEYGITLDQESHFKLQYYLIRNFLGWGRLDALMNDHFLEDI